MAVLGSKAIPLALGACATALVFLPRSLAIIALARDCQASNRCAYDDVQAALLLTQGFCRRASCLHYVAGRWPHREALALLNVGGLERL